MLVFAATSTQAWKLHVQRRSYRTAALFHCPQIRIALQNLAFIVLLEALSSSLIFSSSFSPSPQTPLLFSSLIACLHPPFLPSSLPRVLCSFIFHLSLSRYAVHGDLYAFCDSAGSRQCIQSSSSKAIYLSPNLAWPLFVKSRLPLKVSFKAKARVLFLRWCKYAVSSPSMPCQGVRSPAGPSQNTEGFRDFFFPFLARVVRANKNGSQSVIHAEPEHKQNRISFFLCIHRIKKFEVTQAVCFYIVVWSFYILHCNYYIHLKEL